MISCISTHESEYHKDMHLCITCNLRYETIFIRKEYFHKNNEIRNDAVKALNRNSLNV